VISFQLETNNNECLQAGLYLQSETNLKPSNNCTHLVKDHYYISSSQILYLNFLSKYSNANGFWIIYEATDSDSKINLKCASSEINELRTKEFTIDQANTSIRLQSTTSTTTATTPTTSFQPIGTTSSSTKLVLKKNSTKQVLMKQFISSIKPDLDRKKVLKLMTLKTKKKSTTLSITSTTSLTPVTNTSLRYLFNQSITNETTSKLILYFIQ
jgi:hypothetical protein